jgi:UDP:flavonoid glycosyltransferase YjiC (YdhE family)
MSKSISFIVCSNGYGHLKRCLQVVDALPKGYTINFFCKEPQLLYAKNEINFKKDIQINFISKYSMNEFSWIEEQKITWDKYNYWKRALENSQELSKSDLIISDNHVLPVSLFDRLILMGSFLWHDVTLTANIQGQEIIAHEKELLSNKPTSLICLGDMVMPSLNNQVSLLKQGWFTQRVDIPYVGSKTKKILITGGGTELINKQLLNLVYIIAKKNINYEYFLDSKLFKMNKDLNRNLKLFSFSDEDFASLDYVVCRPGIGILTDCVRFSIPSIVINDGFNQEINHNTKMVNELGIGIGIDININNTHEVADNIIEAIQDKELRLNCLKQLKNREVNGAVTTSQIIINFIENGHYR